MTNEAGEDIKGESSSMEIQATQGSPEHGKGQKEIYKKTGDKVRGKSSYFLTPRWFNFPSFQYSLLQVEFESFWQSQIGWAGLGLLFVIRLIGFPMY